MSRFWIRFILLVGYVYAEPEESLFDTGGIVPVRKFGEKFYFFSYNFKVNFLNANNICEQVGMNLVSVTSEEINDFLYRTINSVVHQDIRYWTSGSKLIDQKNFIWFSNAEKLSYTNWLPGNPTSSAHAHCIEVQLTKDKHLKWHNEPCYTKLSFICESSDYFNSQNKVSESWKGLFADPQLSPYFPIHIYDQNSYFIQDLQQLTYNDADLFCKMIGMELVSIESSEESNFIYNRIRDNRVGKSFWSGGNCLFYSEWRWFPSGNKVTYTNWKGGKGSSNLDTESCIELLFEIDKDLFWTNSPCTKENYFICKAPSEQLNFCPEIGEEAHVPHKPHVPHVPHQPHVPHVPQEPHVPHVPHVPEVPNVSETPEELSEQYYHIGKEKLTYADAIEKCHELGLRLVTIENEETNLDVSDDIQKTDVADSTFWTSGFKDPKVWRWLSGEIITKFFWKIEPGNESEVCLAIQVEEKDGKKVAYWYSFSCSNEYYYICEPLSIIVNPR